MQPSRSRLHAAYFLGIGLAVTGLALLAHAGGALQRYEADTVDARFALRGDGAVPGDVVLVKVDDQGLRELSERRSPSGPYVSVIRRLREAGARTIAIDLPTTGQASAGLLDAIRDAAPVVIATPLTGAAAARARDSILRQSEVRAGGSAFSSDPLAVLREFPYRVGGLESFPVAAAETFLGRTVPRADFPDGRAWIDYAGRPGTIPGLSFATIQSGAFDPRAVRGKLVVVGPYSSTAPDVHATSVTSSEPMYGAEVQANAIATILRGFPLRSAPPIVDVMAIVLLGMFAPLVALRVSFLLTLALSTVAGATFATAAQLAFNHGSIVAFSYPLGALILSTTGVLAVYYVLERDARHRVRDMFARFVPEGVVNDVLARAGDGVRLGGVQVVGTVMFADLRGFATFAEEREAEEVIEILNRYLSEMSEAILDHGGTLVSYLGDGILAVFGAPIEQLDHAERAYATACEMLDVRLPRFNEWLRAQHHDMQFRMGIGLNSGPFVSGNVGSERRLEYTAIGDTANTASRIEGLTKEAGTMLLVSEATKLALPPDAGRLVFYDEAAIRGRTGTVRLWALDRDTRSARGVRLVTKGRAAA
jgi:adenylate cyclase